MKRLGAAVLTVALAACGRVDNVGSRYVKSQDVGASSGGLISVSASEEPTLAGTTLDIPAGALPSDTRITLEVGSVPLSTNAAGPIAVWGPAGLHFSQPARMTLPVTLPGDALDEDVYIEVLEATGEQRTIEAVSVSGAMVSFNVEGFTAFQPSTRTCQTDNQCSSGKSCVAGRCRRPHNAHCSSSAQCGVGSQCLSGTCQPLVLPDGGPQQCVSYLDCGGVGTQCVNGSCQPLVLPDAGPVTCGGAGGGSGANDGGPAGGAGGSGGGGDLDAGNSGGCDPGLECVNGTCQSIPVDGGAFQCTSSIDCGIGSQCINGTCQPLVPPSDGGQAGGAGGGGGSGGSGGSGGGVSDGGQAGGAGGGIKDGGSGGSGDGGRTDGGSSDGGQPVDAGIANPAECPVVFDFNYSDTACQTPGDLCRYPFSDTNGSGEYQLLCVAHPPGQSTWAASGGGSAGPLDGGP